MKPFSRCFSAMKSSRELKAIVLATVSGLAAVGLALGAGEIMQPKATAATVAIQGLVIPPAGTSANQGYQLFMHNCAHCHGTNARGDEGPDLHGLVKSDAKIASLVKDGKKGEMPAFGKKLGDGDLKALIAFLRTLD